MQSVPVYFALGTNLGDRSANLAEAERRLGTALDACVRAKSSVIETPAWGFDGEDFLNCVLRYDVPCELFPRPLSRPMQTSQFSERQALALLDMVKGIETEMGRVQNVLYDENGHRIYHSRIIDIDILFIGTQRFSLPRLTVPHPLMAEREFVMKPLREIAPAELTAAFPEIFGWKTHN